MQRQTNAIAFLFVALALFFPVSLQAQSNEILERIDGPVVNFQGDANAMTQKANLCMATLLRNQSGHGSSNDLFIFVGDTTIVANSQIEYSHRMLRRSVKSKITFEARENRFRLTHTEIAGKILDTTGGLGFGASVDDGSSHSVIYKNFGTGWQEARNQLQNLSDRVTACIIGTANEDW